MNKTPRVEGSIAFDKSKYDTEEEFGIAFSRQIELLTEQDYIVLVRYEEEDIYVINYCYDNIHNDYGADRFMLVSSDEEGEILALRQTQTKRESNNDAPKYTIKNDDE